MPNSDAGAVGNSGVDYPGLLQPTFPAPPTFKRPYRRPLDTSLAGNARHTKTTHRGSVGRNVNQDVNGVAVRGHSLNVDSANEKANHQHGSEENINNQCNKSDALSTASDSDMRVVWSGQVSVNGSEICSAELVSRCHFSNMLCFTGTTLDISNKLWLSSIHDRYLSRLSSEFTEQHEFIDGGLVQYAYSMLRSVDSSSGLLDLFIDYLRKSNAGGFIDVPDEQILLLLPDSCDIMPSVKTCHEENMVFLHCIVVSMISQSEQSSEDFSTRLSTTGAVESQSTDVVVSTAESSYKPSSRVSIRDPRTQNN